jgi:P27 family predicted phage terminase small subunit
VFSIEVSITYARWEGYVDELAALVYLPPGSRFSRETESILMKNRPTPPNARANGHRMSEKPPRDYSPEAKRVWRELMENWNLDPAARPLLDTVCRALMRVREAQQLLARDGLVVRDRFGQAKPHPAAAIERDAQQTLLRNLRALNLDLEPLHDRPGRPGGS